MNETIKSWRVQFCNFTHQEHPRLKKNRKSAKIHIDDVPVGMNRMKE